MKVEIYVLKVLLVAISMALGCCVAYAAPPAGGMPKCTILYDNNPHDASLKTGWGFSCLIEGREKTILFDTGGDGSLLLANMRKLGIAPRQIDALVISHLHGDHMGGMHHVLRKNREAISYLPGSFSESFRKKGGTYGSKAVHVHGPVAICEGVFSTGELGTMPREQSLVVRTTKGLIIVAGCAHAGIGTVVRTAKEQLGGEILLVIGGFHLVKSTKAEVETVIANLKMLGVRHVAACHCTSDLARRLFRQAFGSGFIDTGVGKVIDTEELR